MNEEGQDLSERERAALYSEGIPEEDESDDSDADFETLTARRGHECPEQRAAEARAGERDRMSPYRAVVKQWDDVMDAKGDVLVEDVAGAD